MWFNVCSFNRNFKNKAFHVAIKDTDDHGTKFLNEELKKTILSKSIKPSPQIGMMLFSNQINLQ